MRIAAPSRLRRPLRLVLAAVVAATATVVPVLPGGAAPTPVVIPISEGGLEVNGTTLNIPTVTGAALTGTYDPDTGAFSGNLVIPSFVQSGTTSLSDAFTLTFSPVSAAVTGTIPQSGTGTLGPVGWTVGVALPGASITGCSVTIAPLTLQTLFDPVVGALVLTAAAFTIPGTTCTNPSDEPTADGILAIPTTTTILGLLAVDASPLRPPAPEPEPEPAPRPTFTG